MIELSQLFKSTVAAMDDRNLQPISLSLAVVRVMRVASHGTH